MRGERNSQRQERERDREREREKLKREGEREREREIYSSGKRRPLCRIKSGERDRDRGELKTHKARREREICSFVKLKEKRF